MSTNRRRAAWDCAAAGKAHRARCVASLRARNPCTVIEDFQNPHPNGFWMGFGCLLVTLWMLTDGRFQLIQSNRVLDGIPLGFRWAF